MIPFLSDDKPDAVVIHVTTNEVLKHKNHIDIANNIIQVSLRCRTYGENKKLFLQYLQKRPVTCRNYQTFQ